MSYFQIIKTIFSRKGLSLFSVGLYGGLAWLLHFIIEFQVLYEVNTSFVFIIMHFLGLICGSFLNLIFLSKLNRKINFLGSTFLLGGSIITLILTTSKIVTIIMLGIAGFTLGCGLIYSYILLETTFKNPKDNGKINNLAFALIGIIIIVYCLLMQLKNKVILVGLICIIVILIYVLFVLSEKGLDLTPRTYPLRHFFRKDVLKLNSLMLSFFIGFMMINVYYATIILLQNNDALSPVFMDNLIEFLIILFITTIILSIPLGILYDTIGRRWSIIIGIYLMTFSFLAVAGAPVLFPGLDIELIYLRIFPIFLGIGMSLTIFGGFLVANSELVIKKYAITHNGCSWFFLGLGSAVGLITDTILEQFIKTQPFIFILAQIFMYFTITISIFQLPETLPSKSEQEWAKKTELLIVINHAGLPLYSHSFKQNTIGSDIILTSGAIVGISSIVNEITKCEDIECIRQKDYCIMLEKGKYVSVAILSQEELKILRNKEITFLEEFENFFGLILEKWSGDLTVFSPTNYLIEKYF